MLRCPKSSLIPGPGEQELTLDRDNCETGLLGLSASDLLSSSRVRWAASSASLARSSAILAADMASSAAHLAARALSTAVSAAVTSGDAHMLQSYKLVN